MRRLYIALISVIMCLAITQAAWGYCAQKQNTTIMKWDVAGGKKVQYKISSNLSSSSKEKAAIDAAFATWNAVPCSALQFQDGGSFPASTAWKDSNLATQTIYIYWYDSTNKTSFPIDAQYAYTMYSYYTASSTIDKRFVAINGFSNMWSAEATAVAGKVDLQNEMTVIIGYLAGLAASTVSGSVMNGYGTTITQNDISKRVLGNDDKLAIQYLYNNGSISPTPPAPGTDGCNNSNGSLGTCPGGGTGSGSTPGSGSGTSPGSSSGDAGVKIDSGSSAGIIDAGTSGSSSGSSTGTTGGSTSSGNTDDMGALDSSGSCSCRLGDAAQPSSLAFLGFCLAALALHFRKQKNRR